MSRQHADDWQGQQAEGAAADGADFTVSGVEVLNRVESCTLWFLSHLRDGSIPDLQLVRHRCANNFQDSGLSMLASLLHASALAHHVTWRCRAHEPAECSNAFRMLFGFGGRLAGLAGVALQANPSTMTAGMQVALIEPSHS
jgi:hypothetical protein